MERLEAAMAKARAARAEARRDRVDATPPGPVAPGVSRATAASGVPEARPDIEPDTGPDKAAQDKAALSALWQGLRPVEIPARLARRKRLNALMGSAESAPYDILRTRVLRQMRTENWKRLAVTSPNKGCGKTTASLNLALSMARQAELRVILMDFDLRRPALASLLEQSDAFDMVGLLTGQADFAAQAVRFGPNLAVGLNRRGVPNSAELLLSPATATVLDEIEARFRPDVMLFDTPPMLGNDDNLAFLGQVDCTLLVAAADSTSLAQIDAAERDLAGLTNVVGTVLNKCRYLDSDESYDGGYY